MLFKKQLTKRHILKLHVRQPVESETYCRTEDKDGE